MDRRLHGIVLLITGILVLVYRGFTYTRETHQAELGPVEIQRTLVVDASLLMPLPRRSR